MDSPVLWSAILLGVAVILFLMETMVPSGAMALLAGICAIAGIVMLFEVSTTLGLIGAIVSLLGLPFLLFFALRLWPNTPIARMLLLRNPGSPGGQNPDNEDDPAAPRPMSVTALDGAPKVGMTGKAISDLRPVGICIIEGRRVDCLAEGGIIRGGTAIRVTAVDGMHIKVRPAEEM